MRLHRRGVTQVHDLAGNDFGLWRRCFDRKSEAGLQNSVQLLALLVHDRIAGNGGQLAPQGEQRRRAGGGRNIPFLRLLRQTLQADQLQAARDV